MRRVRMGSELITPFSGQHVDLRSEWPRRSSSNWPPWLGWGLASQARAGAELWSRGLAPCGTHEPPVPGGPSTVREATACVFLLGLVLHSLHYLLQALRGTCKR